MKISIICVGKIKEKFYKDAINEYLKRLSKYIKINIIEVNDEKAPENISKAQEEIIKNQEGERILKNLKDNFIICLAIEGKKLNSEEFSKFINEKMISSEKNISFIIGGSLGLSAKIIKKADFLLSFSDMTFPHQLMRVILTEQIYRAYKIIKKEPYHK